MKELPVSTSLRARRVFHVMAWAVIVLSSVALLPLVLHGLSGFAAWFTSLFPHLSRLWEDSPWSY